MACPKTATRQRKKLNSDEEDSDFVLAETLAPQKLKDKAPLKKLVRKEYAKPADLRAPESARQGMTLSLDNPPKKARVRARKRMSSSSDITHASGDVSSCESDNPRPPTDGAGSSKLERDRAAAITLMADWAEFKRARATEELTKKSAKKSEIQKRNTYPHHMGVPGYYGKKPIWDQEHKEVVAAGGKLTFNEIRGEHARDYLQARARRRDDGIYYFENSRDEELYLLMLKASKIPGRKEERLNMKKARSEMKQNKLYERLRNDMYLTVQKEIEESMMMQKTLTLTDSEQMGGEVGMEDDGYCAATLHKSSCASANPNDN
ncbi:hypothetical protein D1007_45913 [Hordeum vulgare]|nr:hypothetical protein D1007_45913 [Hordeum vulgare]